MEEAKVVFTAPDGTKIEMDLEDFVIHLQQQTQAMCRVAGAYNILFEAIQEAIFRYNKELERIRENF